MRVAELTAAHVRIPLKKPIRHASHSRTDTDNVIVKCVLADGSVGFGEGVPRDYVTGETADSALELLAASDPGRQLEVCRDFEQAVRLAERMKLNPIPGDDRGIQGNAARCAVELAVLDAYGRAFGEPLMHVARLLEPDLYQPKEKVQYSGIITAAKGLKARVAGLVMRTYGFKQIKVKVGIPGYDDPARLKAIRGWFKSDVDLRVDANEAWPEAEAAERILELEAVGISSVEQPVSHEEFATLPEIAKRVNTPIMLDESLCGEVDAERAVRIGGCSLFNLRLSKCGGFIPTLKLAAFATRHGLGYQLGCQVGETAILSAAGRQFATSVKDIRYLEGSYDRHLVREALGEEDITFKRGGWAPMLVGCGTGVKIDPARLAAVTVRTVSLVG
ncbi:MAG TPA: enolase C-terminal domain-like protein [Fimbriiglobus sp.]|jgi:muconate cycloisomerase